MAWIRCMGGNAAKTVGTDKVPYLLRATPFDANLKKMKLVGGSVAFNQLVQNGNFASTSGWYASNMSLSASNNILTATVTNGATLDQNIRQPINGLSAGHKYILWLDINPSVNTTKTMVQFLGVYKENIALNANTKTRLSFIFSNASSTSSTFAIFADRISASQGMAEGSTIQLSNVNIIDLTVMFGSTIADYIYSLEQGTAGAGVAFSRKMIVKDYNAYNAGELLFVKPTAHEIVGFNAWDEEWEIANLADATGEVTTGYKLVSKNHIRCLPNTAYYKRGTTSYGWCLFYYYDADKNFISHDSQWTNDGVFTTPANCYYMKFKTYSNQTGYNNDICINISDASKNGTYEPYKKYSYPLDGTKRVYRKYKRIDLGSLTWYYSSENQAFYSNSVSDKVRAYDTVICSRYARRSETGDNWNLPNKGIGGALNSSSIYIKDTDYTDGATLKTALDGVYAYYETNTPFYETVENPELRGIFKLDSNNKLYCDGDTCEDIVSPMAMMSGGTEAFVDSRAVPVPVGHESTYYSVDFPE